MDETAGFRGFSAAHDGTLRRLRAAGIVADFGAGPGLDDRWVRFTPAFHRLMRAGRHPLEEPAFLRLWRTGDPVAVRAWVDREAAALGPLDASADGQP